MSAIFERTVDSDRPARSIKVTVVEDFAALEPRRNEWNALVERAQTSTVFQTFEFHATWWKIFGKDDRLLVLLAENDRGLLGIAPLMVLERRFLGRLQRVVQFIGARSFDYTDFIVDRMQSEVLPRLLSTLATSDDGFDLLYFRDIPDTSSSLSALRRFFKEQGRPTDVRVLYEAPTRLFNDAAKDRQLPNKRSLKRHYNYFQRSGQLEFKNFVSAEEILSYLEIFFQQHIRRRAATDTTSLFVDERMRAFFRELVVALAPAGWLLFSVVLFNRKPIAVHFGFEYGNRITWYKPAFDMDYAKHSPGEVLIKYLIEYALERKVKELDFTIGEEPFKYRFANHTRSNCAVRVYRHWLSYRVNRLLLDAKGFVQRSAPLTRIARRTLGRWRDQPWL